MAKLSGYAAWRRDGHPSVPAPRGLQLEQAHAIVHSAVGQELGWLNYEQVTSVLNAYGIATSEGAVVNTTAGALQFASSAGYPLAVKAMGHRLVHKSDGDQLGSPA